MDRILHDSYVLGSVNGDEIKLQGGLETYKGEWKGLYRIEIANSYDTHFAMLELDKKGMKNLIRNLTAAYEDVEEVVRYGE
ncbi:hypothetical protein SALINJAH_162 [Bacillus phage SalinJah]|uniref:Uncharacterized protein n=1 Tax=Bacillus phage SalinJah TaxID=1837830 RepID=A0A173GB78_9CAUD|nr:hypothetical protein SALINJAH_162 [Bacillus phage SalinJah]ANH50582.1 hypothetical protein SALINJAH_162 [Bacillus phage SalinJah]